MRILLLNQTFYPDVVSTSQHASDLAVALAADGHQVTVVASRRAYDDPTRRFPGCEVWKGVQILRVPCFGFGKTARWRRALDYSSFLAACSRRLIFLPKFDVVLAMTSPPLISFLAVLFTRLKGGEMVSWLMDLNPDEAIAAGWLAADSLTTQVLQYLLRYTLSNSKRIIVLDHFMKARVEAKDVPTSKLDVIPPWSHDPWVCFDPKGREAFRREWGLQEKFVIMYSGNHSSCHPLDTLLAAARRLAGRSEIAFCFAGGGTEFRKVRELADRERLPNITCVPYQPLEKLSASLSSADVHAVVMGDPFVGIVHPCKIYNILALGIPVLYIGPSQSHVVDLLPDHARGSWAFAARHGDVDTVVGHILTLAQSGSRRFEAPQLFAAQYSHNVLVQKMIDGLVCTGGEPSCPRIPESSFPPVQS